MHLSTQMSSIHPCIVAANICNVHRVRDGKYRTKMCNCEVSAMFTMHRRKAPSATLTKNTGTRAYPLLLQTDNEDDGRPACEN